MKKSDLTTKEIVDNSFQWDGDLDACCAFIRKFHEFESIKYDSLKTPITLIECKGCIRCIREISDAINSHTLYIETKEGKIISANIGDWIIRDETNPTCTTCPTFTVLTDKEFKNRFHIIDICTLKSTRTGG